ncbi:glutathione s-transferase [Aspergillus sclerotialis]|uniref:Glutathione s-transferase n=1 Tax=Aspergillus sclerotialis TaxID=2070753 RepID=A0A3A2ZWY5_9EURO|nr:glutathione s-transferase [Aspergillus sclerotialis]
MSSLKPITLYSHATGPNPWKVVMLFNELNLPYESKYLQFPDMKKQPYESVNINGRVPAIEDPNTGITIWESGAILEYLVETYDKQNNISFKQGTPEYYAAKQWLHFQMSGQGPYFGQATWFTRFHPEKLESARVRYVNEVRRVSDVLNRALQGKEYLVGGKYSFVDAAFVPWYGIVPAITGDTFDLEKDFPNLNAWLNRIKARPAIAKALKEKADAMAAH